jgi:very-short-patch-repair endonuclease
MSEAMDGVTGLAQLGGTASRSAWRRLVGEREADRALAAGDVMALPRWQVALPDLGDAERAAAAAGGTVSHLSAALHHGWKIKAAPPCPTITVPRKRRVPVDLPECRLFWGDLPEASIERGVTSPVRTVMDCARAYERDAALCVADSALRSGMVDPDELRTAAAATPRTGRGRARWVAAHASELAANPFESVLRHLAVDVPGLQVRPQGWVGRAGRADLVDDRLLIAIEADSWEHHGAPDLFRRDVRRYTEFARLGWVVARFVWEDVMHQHDRVRRHLREVADVRGRQLGIPAA